MTLHLLPHRLRLGAATAIGLLALAANAAQAQTPPAFDLTAPGAGASLPAAASTTPGLAPLLASPAALRFAGEAARRTFPVFVTGEQSTQAAARLSLGYTTAVSVAPEGSSLVVSINGVEVASQALRVGSLQALDLPVPPGLLRPGFNAVDVAVQQFHRVDCSIEGTYELWTALDPSRSGLTFGRTGAQMAGLSDLPMLPRDADGKVRIAGLVPSGAPSARVDATLAAIEAAVLIGAVEDPLVRLGDTAAGDAGLEVAVGTFDELGGLARQPSADTPWAGVSFVPAKVGRAATLIVSGATSADVDRALAALGAGARVWTHDGSPAGLQALADRRGRTIAAHGSVNLQQLGADTRPFAGRLFRQDLRLSLPADFYAADYDSASLVLNGAYAANLSSDATLFVRANGQVVATLPLSSPHSGQIEEKRLKVPLDRLKPGANTIRIEATLPGAEDATCEVAATGPRPARFMLAGTTRIEMPALARVGAYPNLSATLAGVGVVGERDRELMVYVPGADPAARDAAATLVARMAASSGAIRRTRLVSALPSAQSGDLLAVGTSSALPDDLASLMRGRDEGSAFARGEHGTGWAGLSQARASTGAREPAVGGAAATGSLTLPAFAEPVEAETRIGGITRPVIAAFDDAMARFGSGANAAPLELPRDGALLVQAAAPVYGAAWTLFTAPTSALLTQGIQRLGTAETWDAVAGARTVLPGSPEEAIVTLDEGGERLFETQPRSLSNARLVLAGWFSRHSEQYAGLVLASSILLALSTFLLLRRLGEKSR